MAGGPGWTTFPEHAGQVPVIREYPTQEQRHHTLRHSQRTQSQEAGTHSQVPQGHHRTALPQDKISGTQVRHTRTEEGHGVKDFIGNGQDF